MNEPAIPLLDEWYSNSMKIKESDNGPIFSGIIDYIFSNVFTIVETIQTYNQHMNTETVVENINRWVNEMCSAKITLNSMSYELDALLYFTILNILPCNMGLNVLFIVGTHLSEELITRFISFESNANRKIYKRNIFMYSLINDTYRTFIVNQIGKEAYTRLLLQPINIHNIKIFNPQIVLNYIDIIVNTNIIYSMISMGHIDFNVIVSYKFPLSSSIIHILNIDKLFNENAFEFLNEMKKMCFYGDIHGDTLLHIVNNNTSIKALKYLYNNTTIKDYIMKYNTLDDKWIKYILPDLLKTEAHTLEPEYLNKLFNDRV